MFVFASFKKTKGFKNLKITKKKCEHKQSMFVFASLNI